MLRFSLVLFVALAVVGSAHANSVSVTYTKDIAPLLQAKCIECHLDARVGAVQPGVV